MFKWTETQQQSHIETIYDSAGNPQGWSTLIDKLVTDLDCRSGHISLETLDLSGIKQRFSKGISKEENELVFSHYHKLDIWTKELLKLPKGTFYDSEILASKASMKGKEFYEDYCKKVDLIYLAGAYIESTNNLGVRMALHHSESQGALAAKITYLNTLAPHLKRAAKLHQKFSQLQSQNHSLTNLIDSLITAAIIVDENANIHYYNEGAEQIFKDYKLVNKKGSKLSIKSPLQGALNHIIYDTVRAAQGKNHKLKLPDSLVIRDSQGAVKLNIQVEPFSTYDQNFGLQYRKAMALVTINKLYTAPHLNMALIIDRFNLTKKEALVAEHIAQGKSLDEIAVKLHRSINTIKTQLKSLFIKTETKGQVQLVVTLLSTMAAFKK